MDITTTKRIQIVKSDVAGTHKNTATDFSELANGQLTNTNGFNDDLTKQVLTETVDGSLQLSKGFCFIRYELDGRVGFSRVELVNDVNEDISSLADGNYFVYFELNTPILTAGSSDIDGADVGTLKVNTTEPTTTFFYSLYEINKTGNNITIVEDKREKRILSVEKITTNTIDTSTGPLALKDLGDVDNSLATIDSNVLSYNATNNQRESNSIGNMGSIKKSEIPVILGEDIQEIGYGKASVYFGQGQNTDVNNDGGHLINIGDTTDTIFVIIPISKKANINSLNIDIDTVGNPTDDLSVEISGIYNIGKYLTITSAEVASTIDLASKYYNKYGEKLDIKNDTAQIKITRSGSPSSTDYYYLISNNVVSSDLSTYSTTSTSRVKVADIPIQSGFVDTIQLELKNPHSAGWTHCKFVYNGVDIFFAQNTTVDNFDVISGYVNKVLDGGIVEVYLYTQSSSYTAEARNFYINFNSAKYTIQYGTDTDKVYLSNTRHKDTNICNGIITTTGIIGDTSNLLFSGIYNSQPALYGPHLLTSYKEAVINTRQTNQNSLYRTYEYTSSGIQLQKSLYVKYTSQDTFNIQGISIMTTFNFHRTGGGNASLNFICNIYEDNSGIPGNLLSTLQKNYVGDTSLSSAVIELLGGPLEIVKGKTYFFEFTNTYSNTSSQGTVDLHINDSNITNLYGFGYKDVFGGGDYTDDNTKEIYFDITQTDLLNYTINDYISYTYSKFSKGDWTISSSLLSSILNCNFVIGNGIGNGNFLLQSNISNRLIGTHSIETINNTMTIYNGGTATINYTAETTGFLTFTTYSYFRYPSIEGFELNSVVNIDGQEYYRDDEYMDRDNKSTRSNRIMKNKHTVFVKKGEQKTFDISYSDTSGVSGTYSNFTFTLDELITL